MNNNYELNLNYGDLNLKISNMSVSCYGAIGLMDFDYHFDLSVETSNGKTMIKQNFDEDIAFLFDFCAKKSKLKGYDTVLEIYEDDGYSVFELKTDDLKFYKKVIKDNEKLDVFLIELKAYFDYLIEQYIKDHPEN